MRRPLAACLLVAAVVLAATLPGAARADDPGKPARTAPQGPAPAKFAADVPAVTDAEWHFRIGGFGGVRAGSPLHHVPLIMVHGNNVDAGDWYPVRDDLLVAGWTRQELWALSYNGLGGNNGTATMRGNPERDADHAGGDGVTRVTEDDVNVPDLYAFIRMVQAYTGQPRFSLVSHSLGVTLARETLRVHPELRADLVAFIGIAGANDGTAFCPPGSQGVVVSCDEIAQGTAWLARLNAAGQTYPPARWLTVYDGSGAGDPAYPGPTYAQSPRLAGADNRQYPATYHNDLRIDAPIVADYRTWLEAAERPWLAGLSASTSSAASTASTTTPTGTAPARSTPTPAATAPRRPTAPARGLAVTGGAPAPAALLLLALAVTVAALGRRVRTSAVR